MHKKINLCDLVSLSDDYKLSQKYVLHLIRENNQYRHEEIRQIKQMIDNLGLDRSFYNGFYYSFKISRLNKEFDLVKITNKCVINIELKCVNVGKDRILHQLIRNRYYLKLISPNICSITYVSKTNNLYLLVDNHLVDITFDDLRKILKNNKEIKNVDIDSIYSADNILASPIYTPNRFLNNQYVLTESQENIKNKIVKSFISRQYVGLTGQAGTGKTLLIYDLAKNLKNKNQKVLILDSNKLSNSQLIISSSIKVDFKYQLDNYDLSKYEYVLIDEAQNLKENIIYKLLKSNCKILFSYDKNQIFSYDNENNHIIKMIQSSVRNESYHLSYKVRLTENMFNFIEKLFNLNKQCNINFDNIHIRYFNNFVDAENYAKSLKNVCYIDYKFNLFFNQTNITNKENYVIYGKEYNNVCMIMDERFYYQNNVLYSVIKDNYNYKKMLLFFLTRARIEIYLLVVGKRLMEQIEKMF